MGAPQTPLFPGMSPAIALPFVMNGVAQWKRARYPKRLTWLLPLREGEESNPLSRRVAAGRRRLGGVWTV